MEKGIRQKLLKLAYEQHMEVMLSAQGKHRPNDTVSDHSPDSVNSSEGSNIMYSLKVICEKGEGVNIFMDYSPYERANYYSILITSFLLPCYLKIGFLKHKLSGLLGPKRYVEPMHTF